MDRENYEKERFQTFYQHLENKRDIYYLCFSTGLLHWAIACLKLIPDEVNVVILCANLDVYERRWMEENINRPVHFIEERLIVDGYFDINFVWECLFSTNEYNFGWIDVDCFIFNTGLLTEMSKISESTAINCIMVDVVGTKYKLRTPFLFINTTVLDSLRQSGQTVTPRSYFLRSSSKEVNHLDGCEQLSGKQWHILDRMFEKDDKGNKIYPTQAIQRTGVTIEILDTLVMYQFTAEYCGYQTNRTRKLIHNLADPAHNEVIHIGGASHYKFTGHSKHEFTSVEKARQDRYHFIHTLMIDYLLMEQSKSVLPKTYNVLQRMLHAAMAKHAIPKEDIRRTATAHLMSQGLTEYSVNRLLGAF